eukprot:TRINITY_DN118_c1_g1_i1.p1 TRINITY_DN118_c1_g1~~TRINITY_DN118_c1_g1_i1.p1  ORF type:complete len:1598 (-),score=548.50 TRINITY_DN118_c1_g1_i1:18136-22929(-)
MLQHTRQAVCGVWIEGGQTPAFAAVRHPVALVAVVTHQVVDFAHAIDIDDVFHHARGQHRAHRERGKAFVIGELVDGGHALVDDPQLGGDGLAIDAHDAQAQLALAGAQADQARDEVGMGFGLFPAGLVDRLVVGDAAFELLALLDDADVDGAGRPQLLRLARQGVAQPRGQGGVVLVIAATGKVQRPVAKAEVGAHGHAAGLQRLLQYREDRFVAGQRMQVDAAPAGALGDDGGHQCRQFLEVFAGGDHQGAGQGRIVVGLHLQPVCTRPAAGWAAHHRQQDAGSAITLQAIQLQRLPGRGGGRGQMLQPAGREAEIGLLPSLLEARQQRRRHLRETVVALDGDHVSCPPRQCSGGCSQMLDVPVHGFLQTGMDAMRRCIAQACAGLADIGLGIADVAGTEARVGRAMLLQVREALHQQAAHDLIELVEAGAIVERDVVDLVGGVGRGGGGQQVGLHHVVDVAEVARGLAIAIDAQCIVADHRRHPLRDHGSVGAVRILAAAEHIEVAQADALQAIAAAEDVGVQLVDVLGHRVGRERLADHVFHLGQARMVAVGRAGSGVDETCHLRVAGGDQHVEEAVDVVQVGAQRILDGARHRTQRRLVQHVVRTGAGTRAVIVVADVTFDEAEVGPGRLADLGPDFVQVGLAAGAEVVQAGHLLAQQEQPGQQVGADEAGHAGDEPALGFLREVRANRVVSSHGGAFLARCRSQAPDAVACCAEGVLVELRLDVDEAAIVIELGQDLGQRARQQFLVRHRCHQGIGARQVGPVLQLDAVFVFGVLAGGDRIVDVDFHTIGLQFGHDVDHLGVAQVGAVFLEGQAQHVDLGTLDVETGGNHGLDRLLGHELGHAVVDATTGQDHLRVVAQHLGLVGQVVRVHADAVATDQARTEGQEVPLGTGGLQHFQGIDADLVEDDGEFVHQRDVEVALGVLDHLGGFGHLDAGGTMHAGGDDGFVELCDLFQGVLVIAGDDLEDGGQGVLLVARVDALGGEADVEVLAPLQAGMLFQQGDADFFGGAGIDGGLEHHDGAALHVLAHGDAGTGQRTEVRVVRCIDRRGHGHHDVVGIGQDGRVGAHAQLRGGTQFLGAQFTGGVDELAIALDLALGEVETHGGTLFAKLHCQRKTHITQAYDCNDTHVFHPQRLRQMTRHVPCPLIGVTDVAARPFFPCRNQGCLRQAAKSSNAPQDTRPLRIPLHKSGTSSCMFSRTGGLSFQRMSSICGDWNRWRTGWRPRYRFSAPVMSFSAVRTRPSSRARTTLSIRLPSTSAVLSAKRTVIPPVSTSVLCKILLAAARLRQMPSSEQEAIRLPAITPPSCSVMQRLSRQQGRPVPPPPSDRPTCWPVCPCSKYSHSTMFCSMRLPLPAPLTKAPQLMRSPLALMKSLIWLRTMRQLLAATRSIGVTGPMVWRGAVLVRVLPSMMPLSGKPPWSPLILKWALKLTMRLLRAMKCDPWPTTWKACSQNSWLLQTPSMLRFSKIHQGASTLKPSPALSSMKTVSGRAARTTMGDSAVPAWRTSREPSPSMRQWPGCKVMIWPGRACASAWVSATVLPTGTTTPVGAGVKAPGWAPMVHCCGVWMLRWPRSRRCRISAACMTSLVNAS